MKTIFSEQHLLHAPQHISYLGVQIETFEKPSRAETVHAEVKHRHLGSVIKPDVFSLEPEILALHDPDYITFLQTAHGEWLKAGFKGDAVANFFSIQHRDALAPEHIEGKLGYYLADTVVSLGAGSWQAIQSSAFTALTGASLIAKGSETAAFALCRPPGHHASKRAAAGYCYINNAGVAAQHLLNQGAKRVTILDVDYHHGNGTQDIFYARNDVQFISIHADPRVDYPHFAGYAEECGVGAGLGYNHNYPLPHGTTWQSYKGSLLDAMAKIEKYNPDAIVISLGVDTYKEDPISQFKLETDDYLKMGAVIAELNKPTLFVMEGGYAIDAIGNNVTNVLQGFLD